MNKFNTEPRLRSGLSHSPGTFVARVLHTSPRHQSHEIDKPLMK